MAKKKTIKKELEYQVPIVPVVGPVTPKVAKLSKKKSLEDGDNFEPICAAIQFPHVVNNAQSILSERDGCLILDPEDAIDAGIEKADLGFFKGNISVLNQLVMDGDLKLSSGFEIQPILSLFAKVTIIDATVNGTRYLLEVETTWLGTRYYINKALLNKIAELIEVGGGLVGVAAGLQAAGIITAGTAALTAAVAAILILGAKALKALDFCNGIYVLLPFLPGPPIPYPAF